MQNQRLCCPGARIGGSSASFRLSEAGGCVLVGMARAKSRMQKAVKPNMLLGVYVYPAGGPGLGLCKEDVFQHVSRQVVCVCVGFLIGLVCGLMCQD